MTSLILTAICSPCRAEEPVNVITVTSTVDDLDAFDQQCSLREALHNANTNTRFSPVVEECPGGSGSMTDVIVLQANGAYKLTLNGAGDDAGDLDILDNPQLTPGIDDLRIEVDPPTFAEISQEVLGERVIENHQARTALKDVHLFSGAAVNGGGISNAGGVMLLENVDVGYSTATADGGGLYNDGNMTIRGGNWYNNAAGNSGGGIHHANGTMRLVDLFLQTNNAVVGGGIYNAAQLTIESNSRIYDNNAVTSHGGGIANAGSGNLTVSDSRIEKGKAGTGGGIANIGDAKLVLINTLVQSNEANLGGGIYSQSTVPITVLDSRIVENSAAAAGGGLFIGGLGGDAQESTIVRSLFTGNLADGYGGGLAIQNMPLAVVNTTISENAAVDDFGVGGIGDNLAVLSDSARVVAINVTFASTAEERASLANFGVLTLQNSIIQSSQANDCLVSENTQPVLSLGNNLSSDNSCGLDGPDDLVNTDALLAPLADNGGETQTHALLGFSPAIDAGDADACASAAVAGLDQRGGVRPFGAGCDIGAHEQGAPIPPTLVFVDGFESP